MDDLNLKIIWRFLSLSHGWKTPTLASRASLIHKQEHIVTRALAHLSCVVVFSAGALSQPVEISAFEAADVHPSAPARLEFMRGPFVEGSRYQVRHATMAELIATAYGVAPDHVWGGPNWLEWDRFDIVARPPASSNQEANHKEKLNIMLRQLLAHRFKLVVHMISNPCLPSR